MSLNVTYAGLPGGTPPSRPWYRHGDGTDLTAYEILARARQYLAERGWAIGKALDQDTGGICPIGGINLAVTHGESAIGFHANGCPGYCEAIECFAIVTGANRSRPGDPLDVAADHWQGIPKWNDHEATGEDEVLAAFSSAMALTVVPVRAIA